MLDHLCSADVAIEAVAALNSPHCRCPLRNLERVYQRPVRQPTGCGKGLSMGVTDQFRVATSTRSPTIPAMALARSESSTEEADASAIFVPWLI